MVRAAALWELLWNLSLELQASLQQAAPLHFNFLPHEMGIAIFVSPPQREPSH